MASSDSGGDQPSGPNKEEAEARRRKQSGTFKASELLAAAQAPDVSDPAPDAPEIVSIPGQRKGMAASKASDMLSVAPAPGSSERPLYKAIPKSDPARRRRMNPFKASEMLSVGVPASNPVSTDPQYELPNVDRRVYGPREFAMGAAILLIVGVIAAFVVGRQQEDAHRTVCAGNLRDLSLALLQYAQDNDECLPDRLTGWPGGVTAWNEQEAYTWRRAISPYFKSGTAFRCPSNPKDNQPTGCQVVACGPERLTDGYTISYACNYHSKSGRDDRTGEGYCGGKGALPVRQSDFASPSQMIAVVETVSSWSEFNVQKPEFTDALYTGHHGTSNYLFADGHVAPLEPAMTLRFWRADGRPFSLDERAMAKLVLGAR